MESSIPKRTSELAKHPLLLFRIVLVFRYSEALLLICVYPSQKLNNKDALMAGRLSR